MLSGNEDPNTTLVAQGGKYTSRPTPERLTTKRMPFTPRIIWRLLVVRKVRTTALTAAPNRRDSMSDPGLIQNKWLRLGVSIFADRQLFSSFVLIAHETIHSK